MARVTAAIVDEADHDIPEERSVKLGELIVGHETVGTLMQGEKNKGAAVGHGTALFLASDASRYVAGQTILMEGSSLAEHKHPSAAGF